MNNQFLLVLCGIPASGKTTLAKEILTLVSDKYMVNLVSTDRWRDQEYYSDFKPEKEQEVRRKARDSTFSLLKSGHSVIHDDTNYYTSMRHELFTLAQDIECAFGVLYVNTPLNISLEWNSSRDVIIPPDVITRIYWKFDAPGMKYEWDSPIHIVDLSKTEVKKAAIELLEKLKNRAPITPKDVSTAGISEEYDKSTREVVKEFVAKEYTCRNDPEVSQIRRTILRVALEKGWSLEETRKELLKNLKMLSIRTSN